MSATATPTRVSPRLDRALHSEAGKLRRELAQITSKRDTLLEGLAALDAREVRVRERLALIGMLAPTEPAQPVRDTAAGRLLEGPAIRHTAIAVLRAHPEGLGPIHYRRWLELVQDAGYLIAGAKPPATFLSQIRRSPVIRATTHPGVYELDRGAVQRLQTHAARTRTRLLDSAPGDTGPVALELQRIERDLLEATTALSAHPTIHRPAPQGPTP